MVLVKPFAQYWLGALRFGRGNGTRKREETGTGPTELLPAEAGRLEEIVNYGLKSFVHDLVMRKLSPPSSGSVPSCWRMYSWITSSVTFPLDATK